ncbi:MFS transporter [Chloroflexota bacterium]
MTGEKKPKIFYGYIIIAIACGIMALNMGANRSFGVFLEPLLSEFGWTRAGVSGAFTLCMLVEGLLAIVAGRITDRFGPRLVVIGCALFMGSGYLLMSQVSNTWQLYLFYGVLVGIGASGLATPLTSLVARWFVKRRSLMSGIFFASRSFGNMSIPLTASVLISAYGWRNSYLVVGSVLLGVIVTTALFLKRDPGQIGQTPYGVVEAKANGPDLQAEGLSLREALRTSQFWLLGTVSFCHLFLTNTLAVHLVIYAIGNGVQPTVAASVFSVGAGVAVVGRVVMGSIADRVGNRRALIVAYSSAVFAFVLLMIARELWVFYLFAVIFGFGGWSGPAMMNPLTAELFGLRAHGTILACRSLGSSIGGALGPLLVGYLFDITGSYQLGLSVCIGIIIVTVVALACLGPIRKGVPGS